MAEIPVANNTGTAPVRHYTDNPIEAHRLVVINEICRLAANNGAPFSSLQRQVIESALFAHESIAYDDLLTSHHRHDFRIELMGGGFVRYCTDCSQMWKLYQNKWSAWVIEEAEEVKSS